MLGVVAMATAMAAAGCGVERGTGGELGAAPAEPADPDVATEPDDEPIPDGDDDLASDEAYRIAMEQNEALGIGSDPDDFERHELECIGQAMLDGRVDLDVILTDPTADDEAEILYETVLGCVDEPAENRSLVRGITQNIALTTGLPDLTDAEGSCLLAYILDVSADPARMLVVGDGPDDGQVMADGAADCFTEEHYAIFSGAPGAGPQAYGDDEALDALQDECEDGDGRACDLLYLRSSSESTYESVGETCAGANPAADDFCSDEVELDVDGFAPEDSPGLPILAADCEAGDLTACDLLFSIAPLGSEFEAVGQSCGGRIPTGALPDCRTRFG